MTAVSVYGGSFLETCQHIDVENIYLLDLSAKLFVFVSSFASTN